MVTETKKVLAAVALIIATGVSTVELTRTPAQADPTIVRGGAAGYAGSRVDGAFQVLAAAPSAAPVEMPVAEKGDLPPLGCAGPFRPEIEAECIDAAFEVEAEPSVIVETRLGDASTLVRMDALTVADFEYAAADLQSE
jgi:hypothetical protein